MDQHTDGLLLDRIKLTNVDKNTEYTFLVDDWLDDQLGHGPVMVLTPSKTLNNNVRHLDLIQTSCSNVFK